MWEQTIPVFAFATSSAALMASCTSDTGPRNLTVTSSGTGSASAFANYFSRSVWENNTLKTQEELIFVNDADEYEEYDVDAPYTIKDSEGQTLATFSNASELPQPWRAIVEY